MGIVTRLLVPRTVRRAANPVRTARRAVTPRPIKRAQRVAFTITSPFGAMEGALENAVVDALQPRRRRSVRHQSSTRATSSVAADKYLAAAEENEIFAVALTLHRVEVEDARPIKAPDSIMLDERWVRRQLRKNAVSGTSFFKRKEREAARARADDLATEEVRAERNRRDALRERQEQRLHQTFAALMDNEPAVAVAAAQAALAKLPLDCEVIGSDTLQIDVLITYPTLEIVPERDTRITPTGRPSTRNRSQTERNDLYAEALASAAFAVAKVCVAALPAMPNARVLVVTPDDSGPQPLLALHVPRAAVRQSTRGGALEALDNPGMVSVVRRGRTRKVMPLPTDEVVAPLLAASLQKREVLRSPFDLDVLRKEQEQLADRFAVRIKELRPNAATDGDEVLGVGKRVPGNSRAPADERPSKGPQPGSTWPLPLEPGERYYSPSYNERVRAHREAMHDRDSRSSSDEK